MNLIGLLGVVAVIIGAVYVLRVVVWWSFRVTDHPDPFDTPWFDDGVRR